MKGDAPGWAKYLVQEHRCGYISHAFWASTAQSAHGFAAHWGGRVVPLQLQLF